MTGSDVLLAVIGLAIIALPVATYYKPFAAGVLGVVAMTAAAIFYTMVGKSAMTETTAAVFAVGAFVVAGLLAVAREVYKMRTQFEGAED